MLISWLKPQKETCVLVQGVASRVRLTALTGCVSVFLGSATLQCWAHSSPCTCSPTWTTVPLSGWPVCCWVYQSLTEIAFRSPPHLSLLADISAAALERRPTSKRTTMEPPLGGCCPQLLLITLASGLLRGRQDASGWADVLKATGSQAHCACPSSGFPSSVAGGSPTHTLLSAVLRPCS